MVVRTHRGSLLRGVVRWDRLRFARRRPSGAPDDRSFRNPNVDLIEFVKAVYLDVNKVQEVFDMQTVSDLFSGSPITDVL